MSNWQHPFAKSTITDKFGDKEPPRKSPHRGLDYAPGAKKLIPAVTDSVVNNIFYSDCLGWVCEIRSVEHGIYIGYSHLYCNKHDTIDCDGKGHTDGSTCMSKLKVGDSVKVGQWVGRVGNSGTCSRGAHCHLTMSKKADPRYAKTFDPEKFIDQKIAKQSKVAKKETVKKVAKKPKKAVAGGNKAGRFWTLKK
tara:strand:+ start:54 stop:635 length:582 start_codon:yes stop_codon:yes gene_type:complete